jgi:PAS domain S-box-containing protein
MSLFNREHADGEPGSEMDAADVDQGLVANLAAAVALIAADDGEIVYTNVRWDQTFGYDRHELRGRHIAVVNAATDETPEARARQIFEALARDGVWDGEVHNVRKDGSHFWSHCNVSRFDHPAHGPVWLSVHMDVTAQRAAHQRLLATEQRYRRVFDMSPAPLALLRDDLRLSLVNQAFADVLGYRRNELEGASLPDLTHPEDLPRCTELRARIVDGDESGYRLEERLRNPAGRWTPVLLTATIVRGENGAPLVDILTVKRLKEGST